MARIIITLFRETTNAPGRSFAQALRRLHYWVRRWGWHGRQDFDRRRAERCDARGRPAVESRKRLQRTSLALRSAAPWHWRWRQTSPRNQRRIYSAERRMGDRRRTLHLRSRLALSLVSVSHRRWPHPSLGAHRSAVRSGRLQIALHRWYGHRKSVV